MKPSSFEQAIQAQFDSLAIKVIKTTVKKHHRDLSRHYKRETPFSDLLDTEIGKHGVTDEYECDYTVFEVLGMEVRVSDEQISKALKALSEKKRNIILLSYFMDMTDAEIAELLNLVRSTVQYHRTNSLNEIKKILED